MKQWNIGNTTLRNPNRIQDGLKLLKEFEGEEWDYKLQTKFYDEANKRGIMESEGEKVKEGGKELHARKWISCLNQLGFARAWKDKEKGPIQITEVGNQLVNDEITFEEAMLRQLLKYQLPSIIEKGGNYKSFKVHPFRVFLGIIYGLIEKGIPGLTKEEIGLYVITTLRDDRIPEAIEKIAKYRTQRNAIRGGNPKLDYFRKITREVIADIFSEKLSGAKEAIAGLLAIAKKDNSFLESSDFKKDLRVVLIGKEPKKQKMLKHIKELLSAGKDLAEIFDYYLDEFIGTKRGTLKDYADSQIRYVMTTGLFSLNKDRIVIKPNKMDLIEPIVAEEVEFIDDKDYLEYFYNPELPRLPLDDAEFMVLNVGDLQQQIEALSKKTGIDVEPLGSVKMSVPKLKKISQELEKKLIEQKEYIFYKAQSLDEQIDEIVEYFEMIRARTLLGGDAYFPAYYEWTIWRVFLAINTLVGSISDTRNFQIDEELKPIHHAKGGVPDMVFNYADFAIICEATLHQSTSQFEAEYASVPRHVGKMVESEKKPVYGIFIAPKIDPDMAQQLFIASKHVNGEFISLNIIPMSTEQIVGILQSFRKQKFSIQDFKRVLEKFAALKTEARNGKEWYENISKFLAGDFLPI